MTPWLVIIAHKNGDIFAYGPYAEEGKAVAAADNARRHDGDYWAVHAVPLRPPINA